MPHSEKPATPQHQAPLQPKKPDASPKHPELDVLKSVLPLPRTPAEDPLKREIVFIMGREAEILFGSAALFPTLGYDPHELRGVSLFTLMNPEDAADLGGMLEAIDPGIHTPTRVRVELRHKEGSTCVLVGTTKAISEEGFGRSYIMRVRVAAFQSGTLEGETNKGDYFKRVGFEDG